MPSSSLLKATWRLAVAAGLCAPAAVSAALTWYWSPEPTDTALRDSIAAAMNAAVASYNTYANYAGSIPVNYNAGVPTAQASYQGTITFGGQIGYRTAMHEMAHWLGTGTYGSWSGFVAGKWNGLHATAALTSWDGPGERIGCDSIHYWPYGWNYDSEAVYPERMVTLVGALRRDMGLSDGSFGVAPGTYRLMSRATTRLVDVDGATADSSTVKQIDSDGATDQQWVVTLVAGGYFKLQNSLSGKYLDSLGATAAGAAAAQYAASSSTNQEWQLQATDSGFFRIVNRASGKCLDTAGLTGAGAGLQLWTSEAVADQEWKFIHVTHVAPPALGLLSQAQPATSSSTESGNYEWEGNDGITGSRWTASTGSYPQWWRVDLGSVQAFTRVVIDWFNSSPRAYQYRIETSNDDTVYTTLVDKTSNTVQGTTTDSVTASARYVRVTVTGSTAGYAAFWECRVFNDTAPMQQLSHNRTATASSSQAGRLPMAATDNDTRFTRWTASSNSYPQSWTVDLGAVQPVNRALIHWFEPASRAYQYRLEGSVDGTNFTTLVDRTGNTTLGASSDTFSALARYLRVTVTGVLPTGGYAAFLEAMFYRNYAPVPAPWSTADIGAVAATGGAAFLSGAYTVSGSGADIAGAADEFRYVYQVGSGDCSATARVAAVQATAVDAKAGVMIRESTAANARFAAVYVTPGVGVVFQRRTSTGGSTASTVVSGVTAPRWVRIVRTGSSFAAYHSADGSTWTQIGSSQSITMATAVQLGLCVTSHLDGTVCSAVIDSVTAVP